MENQGFSQRGASLALSLCVHKRIKASRLLSPRKQQTWAPRSTDSTGKLVQGYKCLDLDHKSGVFRLGCFSLSVGAHLVTLSFLFVS